METQLFTQLPAALTAEGVADFIRGIESTVSPGIQRVMRPFHRQLHEMDAMLRGWDMRRRRVRNQIQLRSERMQRLEAALLAHSTSHGAMRERLRYANGRLRDARYEFQRIEHVISEAERLIAGYRHEVESFEAEIRAEFDRVAAIVRQRGPIARA